MELQEALNLKTIQTSTPKSIKKHELTDQLLTKLFQGHKTFTQACQDLHLTRNRGYKLWNDWKQTSEAQLVDTEWWELYLRMKTENPEKALECLTRIKHRMTTEKREIQKTIKEIRLNWDVHTNLNNTVLSPSEAT